MRLRSLFPTVSCRFDYNNMLQGVSYLLAKLDPGKKEQWSRPIRETMTTWLRGQDNITYTPKVSICNAEKVVQSVFRPSLREAVAAMFNSASCITDAVHA